MAGAPTWVDPDESPSAGPVPVDISRRRWRRELTIATRSNSPSRCWCIRCSTIAPAASATAQAPHVDETDNQLAWQWYLKGADPKEAAPARREDLSGLPPAWMGSGRWTCFVRSAWSTGDACARRVFPCARRSSRRLSRVRPDCGQGADFGEVLRQSVRSPAGCPRCVRRLTSDAERFHGSLSRRISLCANGNPATFFGLRRGRIALHRAIQHLRREGTPHGGHRVARAKLNAF